MSWNSYWFYLLATGDYKFELPRVFKFLFEENRDSYCCYGFSVFGGAPNKLSFFKAKILLLLSGGARGGALLDVFPNRELS